jgi:hypothetical protein
MLKMNVYELIENRCKNLGISISELCRQTKVNRQALQSWKDKNPASIERKILLEKKLDELETLKNEKNV